ncbi:phosphatase [Streptomyces sp. DSM 42041]|uniref:Phosphatase n=1 Tax=Streptomyces hazeniae TaxID=3075538 RepID=A0ABU2NUT8_9ACTN|nr:phosphatase [Streptomyces sp. DSM 42041]MDT0380739.1 phosphatase [Streptomyces sp. DSM 42041]
MGGVRSVAGLRAHLLAAGLAGTVATTREQSLTRYRLFAARDPRALLGLVPERDWTVPELLALMAQRCGVSPDPARVSGRDRIDPDLTLAALDVFTERLGAAVRRREPVLLGTGHPDRLLGFYTALAAALAAAGCPVLTPGRGRRVEVATRFGVVPHRLAYVRGVAVLHRVGACTDPDAPGAHTHSPLPLRSALAAAAAEGGRLPQLVVGDHGWVCAAGALGVEAMGPADTDDPAPFVGEAEGRVAVAVPLNDGASAVHYGPLTRYVLNRARLSQ